MAELSENERLFRLYLRRFHPDKYKILSETDKSEDYLPVFIPT
jgi:hypothetical protein